MKRIVLALGLIMYVATVSWGADEWREGSGSNTVLGTETVSDIDTKVYSNIVAPLDRLLGKYKRGANLEYNSISTIDITAGEISCQNTSGSVTRMRQRNSTLTLSWANIDTGSEANSTTYYVYGVADADATTYTGVISANSTTPDSGAATYYKLIGSFENDASGNIVDSSIEAPAADPDIAIKTVYDYSTSTSSYTSYTTDILMAYGKGTDPFTITNLPFTSSSSYSVSVTHGVAADQSQQLAITAQSASSFTCIDGLANGKTIHWIAVGY